MKVLHSLGGALASAVLLALALPNELYLYGAPLLGFLALVPLYWALLEAPTWKWVFVTAGVFGAILHALSSYWLYFFHGFALWTLGSTTVAYFIVYGVYGLYLSFFQKKAGPWRPLVFALGWVTLEFAKSIGFLGYPWGLLPYTQTQVLPMLQISDVTGIYGISCILAFANAGIAELLLSLDRPFRIPDCLTRKAALQTLGLAGILLCLNLGYGAYRLAHPTPQTGSISTVMVQQNIDPWSTSEEVSIRKNLDLARTAIAKEGRKPDLILFSESTLRRPYKEFRPYFTTHPQGQALIPFVQESGAWLFTGAPIVLNWDRGEATNSVILINPRGEQVGDYAKVHPVPFAEAIPFWEVPAFRSFMQNVVGLDSGWVMGTDFKVFELPLGDRTWKFGAPICFEDAFPDVCRNFFRKDVDLLINLTNDSWSKTDSSEIQHFAAARFRAIESRRTLVRSTNAGVSCVVDAQGRVRDSLPLFEDGALFVDIPIFRPKGETAYVAYGDWFAVAAALLSGLFFLYLGLVKARPKGKEA